MDTSLPLTDTSLPSRADAGVSAVEIPQYRRRAIVAIWAAAALPMAVLAWLVSPLLADRFGGEGIVPMAKALYVSLTVGLVWQFVLVAVLLRREQGTLRWSTVREALWLRSPRSPRSGRIGGRVWLILIPLIVLFGAGHELIPSLLAPENRDFATLVESDAGKAFLSGAWGWYGLILVSFVFNTVLGEELLFRGFLLPRMNGAFGRGDWVANGLLFTGYHLHVPWGMPGILLDMFLLAYPTKRYRSAWIGIAVHSAQSVVLALLLLTLVV
jgi:membrane protease YdiL (CAAX protease family)